MDRAPRISPRNLKIGIPNPENPVIVPPSISRKSGRNGRITREWCVCAVSANATERGRRVRSRNQALLLLLFLLPMSTIWAAPGATADSFAEWVDINGAPAPEAIKGRATNTGIIGGPSGTITTYSDRTAFEAMYPGLASETFDAALPGPGSVTGCPAPFSSTTDNACFAPGALIPGFRVEDDPLNDAGGGSTSGLVVVGTGFSGNSSPTVAANTFVDSFNVFFDDPNVTAVGLDVVTYTTENTVDVQVFDTSDVLLGSTTVAATFDGTFLGIFATAPIGRINIFDSNGGAEGLDELSFGASAPTLILTDGDALLDQLGFVDGCANNATNENGIIEPGETITFNVDLSAAGGDFTNVSATLTAGPDVLVVSGQSSFPDIAEGTSATSSTPFVVYMTEGMGCGSQLSLDMSITSTEDVFVSSMTGEIGQPLEAVPADFDLPDNTPAGVSSTLNVPSDVTLTDVNVAVMATHSWVGDLVITLQSPMGTTLTLLDRPGVPASTFGCGDDNMDVVFDDGAGVDPESTCDGNNPWVTGPLDPVEALSAFNGQSTQGDWILTVSDNAAGDTGTIDGWELITTPGITGVCTICTAGPPSAPTLEIPTLDSIGLLLMVLGLVSAATFVMRRQQ